MLELSRDDVADLFLSFKNNDIGIQEAVDMIFVFQSENRVPISKEIRKENIK